MRNTSIAHTIMNPADPVSIIFKNLLVVASPSMTKRSSHSIAALPTRAATSNNPQNRFNGGESPPIQAVNARGGARGMRASQEA